MLFIQHIVGEIRDFIENRSNKKILNAEKSSWPRADARDMIFQDQTKLELGHPSKESVSFLICAEEEDLVRDGRITCIGPDISDTKEKHLPFGKILITHGHGFNETNRRERYRTLAMAKYDLSLKGYMARNVPQNFAEWCRISKDAVSNGFSFTILGNASITKIKELDFITSAEIVYVTSSKEDVKIVKEFANRHEKFLRSLVKRNDGVVMNCKSCGYHEVCDEASELKKLRKKTRKEYE